MEFLDVEVWSMRMQSRKIGKLKSKRTSNVIRKGDSDPCKMRHVVNGFISNFFVFDNEVVSVTKTTDDCEATNKHFAYVSTCYRTFTKIY